MKKNIRSFISLLVIFTMIFTSLGLGIISPITVNAQQNMTKDTTVKLAVVGKYNEILFSPHEVTVRSVVYGKDIVSNVVYASDVLKAAGLRIEQNEDSGFITSINDQKNGIEDGTYTSMSGWMYKVNGILPNVGAGKKEVKEGDKIFFYYVKNPSDLLPSLSDFIKVKVRVYKGNEIIVNDKEVTVLKGKSVCAAIKEALEKENIKDNDIDFTIGYINKINGIEDTWLYDINDDESTCMNPEVELKDGDIIRVYTYDTVVPKSIRINKPNKDIHVGENLQLTVTALDKEGKNIDNYQPIWKTSNSNIASIDENGLLTAKSVGKVIIYAQVKGEPDKEGQCTIQIKNSSYKERVLEAIDKAAQVALKNHYSMDWVAIGLARAGKEVPSDYLQGVERYLKSHNGEFANKPTEYERMTLGILAAGGDPRNIAGYDLIEKIYNTDLDKQGINALVFGLIALDAGEYKVPENAKWNRDKLIKAILENECSNEDNDYGKKGGWAFWGTTGDPDMTGMAMTALAPYYNKREDVKAAVDRAVEYLSAIQKENGGFYSWGSFNSESCAQVIMGLCNINIDPTGEKFTKNGKNVLDALLSFEAEGGGFGHIDRNVNGMATEQALYALDQYIYYLEGKGSIYRWGNKEDQKAPEIITDLEDKTVKEAKITFTARAEDEKDGEVGIIVKVNGEVVEGENGKYEAVLKEGENKITIEAVDKVGNKAEKVYTIIYKVVKIKRIEIEKINTNIKVGNKPEIRAKIYDEEGKEVKDEKIKWTSSDEKTSIVKYGKIISLKEGKVTITAAVEKQPSIKDEITINIVPNIKTVSIRVEGYDRTIIPKTTIQVPLVDISKDLGEASGGSATESSGWGVERFNNPTNAHAIVKILKDNGFRQQTKEDREKGTDETKLFDFQDYGWGLYIAMIGGYREFDHGGISGWMYRVNGKMPPVGCNGKELEDGDEIVWYYGAYGFNNVFTKMEVDKTEVTEGESINITIVGDNGGFASKEKPLEGAIILVNGKEYKENGELVKTDKEGKASITLKKAGKYEINLTRYKIKEGKREYIDIVRPEPKIIIVKERDKKAPEIITDLEDKTVKEAKITFTAKAEDEKEGEVEVIVKVNDEIVEGENGKYEVVLKEGENKIKIEAVDKVGNKEEKVYTIIYEKVIIDDKNLEGLKDLRIDGKIIKGFKKDKLAYEVFLPSNISKVPKVTAIPSDPNAKVEIKQALDVKDKAVVKVTEPDKKTIKVYTIQFIKRKAIKISKDKPVEVKVKEGEKHLELPEITEEEIRDVEIKVDVEDIKDATIKVPLREEKGKKQALLPKLEIKSNIAKIEIPAGIITAEDKEWDGTIKMPTEVEKTSVKIENGIPEAVIEVGGDIGLTFNKAVRLVIPGQAGKKAAYIKDGKVIEITQVLREDNQEIADKEIAEGKEGKIDVGKDLIIWTKHFTKFIVYTETNTNNDTNKDSSSGGGGSASSKGIKVYTGVETKVEKYGVIINIPKDAINKDIYVKISKENSTSNIKLKEEEKLISKIFKITKDREVDFNKEVIITLPFEKTKVNENENAIAIYCYDEKDDKWIKLKDTEVDFKNSKISGKIKQFTKFAVIAIKKTEKKEEKVKTEENIKDIKGHWAEKYVKELVKIGVISGYPDKTFKPEKDITRAEFITILVKAFKLEGRKGKEFKDIKGHWAKEEIKLAASNGIIEGYEDGTCRPNEKITREEMAVIVAKVLKQKGYKEAILEELNIFTDKEEISVWAREAISMCVKEKIIRGMGDGRFAPKERANRAQAAVMLYKLYNLIH
ncbi:Ig-like domain (group 2) [Caminicella sporogenes DSM 14501]|uniref:Ig-like domain (Group 2) n=1 Tax=Caminicella sporogenes DSM 14501 TaxID=1121266 RepID=A0A1M6SB24_9FIRM|nr:S-layer homology domain-containing protein [Caminicella sporogenes]RKD26934.1 hypothetical protein BET04_10015 [Caminicella sporogenes]SHK41819.1 Ig-like domain (group 2) [Caminicella sporogenes DSM 14501]